MPDRSRRTPSRRTFSSRAPRPRAVLQHAVLTALPLDVVAAKNRLRDRLVPPVSGQVREAMALRRARRYEPDPGLNLVGVGIGEKVTSGGRTGVLCVKVLVARKFAPSTLDRSDRIPASVDGIPTDVEAVGYPRKFVPDNQQRHRPVPGGVSGSPSLDAAGYRFAGTLGLVLDAATGGAMILSNNHVLADENRLPIGAPIVQPATLDGGADADRIGTLAAFAPIKFGNARNWMDAAVAKVDSGIAATPTILGIGPVTGPADPSLNLLVRKAGRTTGMTEGIVRVVRFDVFDVQYEQGMVRVDDVMVIEGTAGAFSRPGDSGSAIVDTRGRVVGLLFAGSDAVTFAIPIRRILRRFKLKIVSS